MKLDENKQNSEILKEAAEWLLDCYKKTKDSNCIQAAGWITKAYMEMGIYDEEESVFDEIMEHLGTTRKEQFPSALYRRNCLKLTASQVREALGRWPKAGAKEESADWVVQDIIDRVKHHKRGCRCYKRGASGTVFKLLMVGDNYYLLNLEKKKVYIFDI